MADKNIWVISTCMGRLPHARKTVPEFSKYGNISRLIVDYNCPNKTGKWVEANHPETHVLYMDGSISSTGRPIFNKPEAQNGGAHKAIDMGATHIIFMDIDTVPKEGFDRVLEILDDKFIIPSEKTHTYDLYGFLAVSSSGFLKSGGFDTDMRNYGIQDADMRLRLHYRANMDYVKMRMRIGEAIPHSDHYRTNYYETKSKNRSMYENTERMNENMKLYSGKSMGETCLDPEAAAKLKDVISFDVLLPYMPGQ